MWSQDAQKTLLDSLEVFLKNPQKIFHFLLFFQKVGHSGTIVLKRAYLGDNVMTFIFTLRFLFLYKVPLSDSGRYFTACVIFLLQF